MSAVYRPVEGPAVARFRQSIPEFRLMPDETTDVEHVCAIFYLPQPAAQPDRDGAA